MSLIWKECVSLVSLGAPIILSNILELSYLVTNTIMIGRVNQEYLAAFGLGNTFFNIVWFFMEGVLTSQDTLISQALGANDQRKARIWMYTALAVIIGMSCLGFVILMMASPLLHFVFMIDNDSLRKEATSFVLSTSPSLFFLCIFRVIQKYFQAKNNFWPPLFSLALANGFHILGNYILIDLYDHGVTGCGIATCISRFVLCLAMVYFLKRLPEYQSVATESEYLWKTQGSPLLTRIRNCIFRSWQRRRGSDLHSDHVELLPGVAGRGRRGVSEEDDETAILTAGDVDVDPSGEHIELTHRTKAALGRTAEGTGRTTPGARESLEEVTITRASCLAFLALGLPGALQFGLQMWSFDLVLVLAIHMGVTAGAAHQTLLTYTWLVFVTVPQAISVALTLRVGGLLGSGQPNTAAGITVIALFFVITLTVPAAVGLYWAKDFFGYIATRDEDVVSRVGDLVVPATIFIVLDAVQGTCQGSLRAMGKQTTLATIFIISVWVTGIPLGVYLAFFARPRFGIFGLWIGFTVGVGLLALVELVLISTVNWEEESRLARNRAINLAISSEVTSNIDLMVVTHPRPGSGGRTIGGFLPIPEGDEDEDDGLEDPEWSDTGSDDDD